MTNLMIEKSPKYAESAITIIGVTRVAYGRPQYILVTSDMGENEALKFPGLRFRAPISKRKTLEDAAKSRFEEQTGLNIDKMLGLRTIFTTRSQNRKQWLFRNVFLGIVSDTQQRTPDGKRRVYLADPGQGTIAREEYVIQFGNASARVPLNWVSDDNKIIARIATDILYNFDWEHYTTNWYRKIPCVSTEGDMQTPKQGLGCGLAISSMMLFYQPSVHERMKIILLQRKGDSYPGYGGGKIETLTSPDSINIDPISCCAAEGSEEFGFPIQPRALICCASTALDAPDGDAYYNSIVNYAFWAEPTNIRKVAQALKNPREHLEEKMEAYVVEDLDEHRDRIFRNELRMPDMVAIGEQFYKTPPGEKVPLTHIRASGIP